MHTTKHHTKGTWRRKNLRCGIYKHYKGKYYLIIGTAQHSETKTPYVVYIPLYEHDGKAMSIRPYANFTAEITQNGKKTPRFQYIGIHL